MNRILYQFPLSHYCEKARWMLDFKHLEYDVRNLFPGAHRLLSWWRAHGTTVPLLKDGKEWIGDSTEMAFWLDARYPQHPLLPNDPLKRGKVAMLEEMADEGGAHLRRWLYGEILDQDAVMNVMLDSYAWAVPVKEYLWPFLQQGIRRLYRVTPEKTPKALENMLAVMTRLEQTLVDNGGRYLVGEQLTLADIAAASLFAPLLAIPGTPWESFTIRSPVFQQVYEDTLRRPFGRWILRLYAEERRSRNNWK